MITGFVQGQVLRLSAPVVAADTLDYLTAQFVFRSADWGGMEKWAHFAKGGTVYDVRLTEDKIRREDHLNLAAGEWKVYVHGNRFADGTVVERITTAEDVLRVVPTGMLDGEPFPEMPASVTEQILARLEDVEQNGGGGGDGYSPKAKVERVEGGVRVTIIDKDGTTSEVVQDGKSGVHVGSDAPSAETRVWVNPSGQKSKIPQIDDTLTQPGYAADAAKVGKQLTDLSKKIADKLDADKLPEAINTALARAKESGEFDGEPGKDYVLTDDDKTEIAEEAAKLVEVPGGGEYRLLKTITLAEEVSQIYETFETGYDGIKCIVENGVIASGGLPFYITVGKGNSLRGCGVNSFKSSNIMWFTAEKANGIWDFDGIHGSPSGVSARVGALTTKNFASTNAVSDGFGVAWDKLYNLRLYSYDPNKLPVGMIVKIYVLGGDDNA